MFGCTQRHHRANKGMGGSNIREGDWNYHHISLKRHGETHSRGDLMIKEKIEAQQFLLQELNREAQGEYITAEGIQKALHYSDKQARAVFSGVYMDRQGRYKVLDVAKWIMGGRLYDASMI